jgi:hypothetical protein
MENNNFDYDLILLVIASRSYIYDELIYFYWLPFLKYIKRNKCRVKIYFTFGNDVPIEDLGIPKENTFISSVNESRVPGILIKTLDAMEFIDSNYKYKHILRSNLGSFFILENLLKVCKSLSAKNTYASHKGSTRLCEHGVDFAHGCGFWISSDVVKELIGKRKNININKPDDIAISLLLKDRDIQSVQRFDMTHNITNGEDLLIPIERAPGPKGATGIQIFKVTNDHHREEVLKYIMSLDHYHIRIKNSSRQLRDGTYASTLEKSDIELMRTFSNKLYAQPMLPDLPTQIVTEMTTKKTNPFDTVEEARARAKEEEHFIKNEVTTAVPPKESLPRRMGAATILKRGRNIRSIYLFGK